VALLMQVSHQVSAEEVLERGVEGLVSEREG
jgi:hypothetical protein